MLHGQLLRIRQSPTPLLRLSYASPTPLLRLSRAPLARVYIVRIYMVLLKPVLPRAASGHSLPMCANAVASTQD